MHKKKRRTVFILLKPVQALIHHLFTWASVTKLPVVSSCFKVFVIDIEATIEPVATVKSMSTNEGASAVASIVGKLSDSSYIVR